MKKIFFLTVLFILIAVAARYGYYYTKKNVGDLRPALLPSTRKLTDIIESDQKSITTEPVSADKPSIPIRLPSGFRIGVYVADVAGARDLQFSPGGTLLVSQPGEGQVVALPDKNKDGRADEVKTVIAGLNRPHGIAFYDKWLYIAEETGVSRYVMNEHTFDAVKDKDLFTLPSGGRHKTRSIAFDKNGNMFVSLGSTCDTCFEKNEWIAAVIVSDKNGKKPELYARGLRNAVFLKIRDSDQSLWGTEMGRDFLGDDLPPDEINKIIEKGDYGWPICYADKIHDTKFDPKNTYATRCPDTIAPVYKIPAHSAPLGLTFITSSVFPEEYRGDLLVAYHGSWNRSTPTGYKIVRLKMDGNTIAESEDFITGFIEGEEALGRPVDMEFGPNGYLYVSDDKAGAVYVVYYAK